RQHDILADEIAIALILGVDRHGRVAQHGLRPGRGNRDEASRLPLDGVADMPQMALDLDLLHLEIGDGGEEARVPVDEALVLVDQPLGMEGDEDLDDGLRETLVHREALARPVAGGAEALQLVDDGAAGLLLPGPDAFHEAVAPEVPAGWLLPLHELT